MVWQVTSRQVHAARAARGSSRLGWIPRAFTAVALAIAGLALACQSPVPERAEVPSGRAAGQQAFDVVYEVLQHPRCRNCHPVGDRPLQFTEGRAHAMNVQRGADDRGRPGMRCTTCHGKSNLPLEHQPPGVASEWHLAPPEMVFEGLSKRELAEMLLDPARSHMSQNELIEHVEHDALVLWGWDPGPGREPVPIPHAEFVAAFRTWVAADTPLPNEQPVAQGLGAAPEPNSSQETTR